MYFKNSYIKLSLLFLFFLTGFTGLVYELLWTRLLVLVFGSTQFAITTVLTVFMAGLAIGSLIFGRVIDRYPYPLLIYAVIELAIGIYCFFTLPIFDTVNGLYLYFFKGADTYYSSFSGIQFILASLSIIIPATLMGGSLPVLVKYFANMDKEVGYDVGLLYSINTLGAVVGCFITGSFLIYFLGIKTALYTAGGIDILVGVVVLYLNRRELEISFQSSKRLLPEIEKPAKDYLSYLDIIVMVSFTLSGFTALSYEILWFRFFSLILGSSIYAFTIMLSTFLTGISIGSLLFARFIDRRKVPLLWFGLLEIVIGISVLASIFLYREFPAMFLSLYRSFSNRFWLFLFLQALLCSTVMILPTLCFGATFPTVGRSYARTLQGIGKSIGDIYFFNTLGAIFGSFIGGFFLIPYIGLQRSVMLITMLNVSIGILLVIVSRTRVVFKTGLVTLVVVVSLTLIQAVPPWEKILMTMGPYVNPIGEKKLKAIKGKQYPTKLLYYKEGINAVITVRMEDGGRTVSYQANGKNEARAVNSKPGEAWSALGHIPLLLHRKPRSALLVGLGSGITLGSMEQYPLQVIDVIEIEPAVVEAARFFSHVHNNALQDDRVRLHIADGRNFLQTTSNKYDVIISAVSDPWITGVSNLFTVEYFQMIDERLKENGVAALWMQNYRITLEDLKISIKTFLNVFPSGSLWFHYSGASDLILIGSKESHSIPFDRLIKKFLDDKVRNDLKRIGIEDPFDLLELFLMGNDDLHRYIGDVPVNIDNKPIIEFSLPKQLYSDLSTSTDRVLDVLANTREVIPSVVILPDDNDTRKEFLINLGKVYALGIYRTDQTINIFKQALELDPSNEVAKNYIEILRKERAEGR